MMESLIAALATLLQPAVAPAQTTAAASLTADQVVAEVQQYYVSIEKLDAKFKQTYTNTVFGKKSESHGKLYIEKPGKMRWDYQKPERKHFISDGTTLWVYEPMSSQAFKQDLKDQVLPVAITFLYGKGDLKADFNAALDKGKYGRKGDVVLKLTPRQPSAQYKNLWLVVDPADFHVRESIILEANDNLNHFRYYDIKLNAAAKFSARHFKFTPPKGVKVIVPQAQAPAGTSP